MFDLNQQNQMAFTPDSGEQQGEIYNAVVSISTASLVDARLIMAVIMQEVRRLVCIHAVSSLTKQLLFSPRAMSTFR